MSDNDMTSCFVPYYYMFVLMPPQVLVLVLVLVLESQVLDNNTDKYYIFKTWLPTK